MANTKTIPISFDIDGLQHYTDEFLASLWIVAQNNPNDSFKDREPGEIAELIGREIVRRWLALVPPPLWNVQGRHFGSLPKPAGSA